MKKLMFTKMQHMIKKIPKQILIKQNFILSRYDKDKL